MALPPLQRKLFQNVGYGPLLQSEIVPKEISLQDWSSSYDYLVACAVRGSDGQVYWSVQPSGPSLPDGAHDPITDNGAYWRSSPSSGDNFPTGTRLLFQQAAAPLGWVKEADSAYDDIAIRITTGSFSGRTNGQAFTACMTTGRTTADKTAGGTISNTTAGGTISNTTAGGTVGNHALSVAQLAKHRHDVPASSSSGSNQHIVNDVTMKFYTYYTSYAGSGSNHSHGFTGTSHDHTFTGTAHGHTFTGTAHNHSIDLDINYVDCIIAIKE